MFLSCPPHCSLGPGPRQPRLHAAGCPQAEAGHRGGGEPGTPGAAAGAGPRPRQVGVAHHVSRVTRHVSSVSCAMCHVSRVLCVQGSGHDPGGDVAAPGQPVLLHQARLRQLRHRAEVQEQLVHQGSVERSFTIRIRVSFACIYI